MFGLGVGEILLLTFVIVLLFGAKKIPALGEAFGKSINSFKKGLSESDQADGSKPKQEKVNEKEENS